MILKKLEGEIRLENYWKSDSSSLLLSLTIESDFVEQLSYQLRFYDVIFI